MVFLQLYFGVEYPPEIKPAHQVQIASRVAEIVKQT